MARSYRTVTGQALHFLLRPHQGVPRGPIRCEAAWKAADLARRGDLVHALSQAEIDELERAVGAARATGKPLGELTARDLPLPTLAGKIAGFRRAVAEGVGVQVMRGVPVDRWSTEDCERFFWCFGHHLGTVGAQNQRGELLGHVCDEGLSYDDPTVRGYRTSAKLDYHCDAADAVGLLCLRTARSGGKSRFVSSVTVFNDLCAARPELVAKLFQPLAFDSRGDGGIDYFMIAPCRYSGGTLRTFYHADYFRSAERQPGAPRLTRELRELLDCYDALADAEENRFEMELAPGDVQLLSNHTVLHSRSAYEDHPEPEKKRHLLRLWLSFDRPRALAELPSLGLEAARLLGALGAGRLRKRLYGSRASV